MSNIFLGKWWHWALLIAGVVALWVAGEERMHVIHFNTFILMLLLVTAIVVAMLVAGIRPGERVTRDRLDSPADHPAGGEPPRSKE